MSVLSPTPSRISEEEITIAYASLSFSRDADLCATDNHARAMRVAEIVSDFRNLQHYMAQIQSSPSAEEYYLPGYSLLRACITEAQAVLASPYSHGANADPGGDLEAEKAQLRAYVLSSHPI